MSKKNPTGRPVRRRGKPAPTPIPLAEPTPTIDEIDALFVAAATTPTTPATEPEHEPKRDPAEICAEVMLAALLAQHELTVEHVRAPGSISAVLVPTADWVDLARRAWKHDVSGEKLTHKATDYSSFRSPVGRTYTFASSEEPSKLDKRRNDELFVQVVGHGHAAVGFAPDLSWLPQDLVAAVDHKIALDAPAAWMLSEAAGRLTGTPATSGLTEDEAGRVTPRLLRLSVRPNQDADAYLLKLLELLDREAAVAVTSGAKSRTIRDEPTLERIHGMDEAVAWGWQLRDDLDAYRNGERSWSDVDRGLLLSGGPGTGKTLFARGLATSCRVPLITGSYGIWMATGSAHQGDLLKAMRKAFKDAKAAAPAILFIDEIDAFADRARVRHYPEWHTEVVNTLLAEIDGVEDREGVVVIGACNHPDKLDPALVRSGRLDRHIRVGMPDAAALASILREHLAGELPGEDFAAVGLLLLGATGADVERLARGARRRARVAGRGLALSDIVAEAGGGETRSGEDLLVAAVHEAGHAVSALVLGIEIEGVTLRGGAGTGGCTRVRQGSNLVTAADVYDRLVFLLSGRAAEEVVLNRITCGAGGTGGSDLQRATILAVQSAAEFGLEESHGLSWTPMPDRETELSAMLAQDPRLARLVRDRLASAYCSALSLVERQHEAVHAVADRLLEKWVLDADEVCRIVGIRGDRL